MKDSGRKADNDVDDGGDDVNKSMMKLKMVIILITVMTMMLNDV